MRRFGQSNHLGSISRFFSVSTVGCKYAAVINVFLVEVPVTHDLPALVGIFAIPLRKQACPLLANFLYLTRE